MTKSIWDMVHVRGVRACVILDDKGLYAGRIVANFSDGGTVTALVTLKMPDGGQFQTEQARASGYGYDKYGSAVGQCFAKLGFNDQAIREASAGAGIGAIETYLKSINYRLITAC